MNNIYTFSSFLSDFHTLKRAQVVVCGALAKFIFIFFCSIFFHFCSSSSCTLPPLPCCCCCCLSIGAPVAAVERWLRGRINGVVRCYRAEISIRDDDGYGDGGWGGARHKRANSEIVIITIMLLFNIKFKLQVNLIICRCFSYLMPPPSNRMRKYFEK